MIIFFSKLLYFINDIDTNAPGSLPYLLYCFSAREKKIKRKLVFFLRWVREKLFGSLKDYLITKEVITSNYTTRDIMV